MGIIKNFILMFSNLKILNQNYYKFSRNCRIYGLEREIWDGIYPPSVNQKNIGLPYIEFDLIHTHLRYPDREGDQLINEQIGGKFIDLIFQDPNEPNYINEGDMDYWFNEPEGGWRQGVARYYLMEELPIRHAKWPKIPKIFDGILRRHI